MPVMGLSSQFEIVVLQSGVRSLRSLQFGETFHPVIGPMAEAEALHVRQQRLVERSAASDRPLVIWDVGLGAAANAVAVLEAFAGSSDEVEMHSFDQSIEPLNFALQHAEVLGYLAPHAAAIRQLLSAGEWRAPSPARLQWSFRPGDFRATMATAPEPDAILYDPYSPEVNGELWTLEHFSALRALLSPTRPCLLTNYTRSTAVRVTLLLAGFFVGRGHATGEKDETTIASPVPGLVEDPLDARWLGRVRRSTRSAPLRHLGIPGPIREEDWQRLAAHPQFQGILS